MPRLRWPELAGQRKRLFRFGIVLFIFSAIVFSSPIDGVLDSPAGATTPSTICPGGVSQCVTVTIPCGSSTCPQITAGPTLDVGNSQYVYLQGADFPAGDEVPDRLLPDKTTSGDLSDGQSRLRSRSRCRGGQYFTDRVAGIRFGGIRRQLPDPGGSGRRGQRATHREQTRVDQSAGL